MSINVKVKCNMCKKDIKEGEHFLSLCGNYAYLKDDKILAVKDDEHRSFWTFCDKCTFINAMHDNTTYILYAKETLTSV